MAGFDDTLGFDNTIGFVERKYSTPEHDAIVQNYSDAAEYANRLGLVDAEVIDVEELVDIAEEYNNLNFTPILFLKATSNQNSASHLLPYAPKDLTGDFTVTGGGNAVSQRSDGTWQINWPANTPRFKYTSGTPYVITEPQRQNLITYPRSFAHSYWAKSGASIQGDPSTAGVELVTNGEFTGSATGWSLGTGWAYLSNSIGGTDITGGSNVLQTSVFESSKLYVIDVNFTLTSGVIRIRVGSIGNFVVLSSGTTRYYLYAESTASLYIQAGSTSTVEIFDISIKQVSGFSCPFVDSDGVNTYEGMKLVESLDVSTASHTLKSASISVISGNKYTQSIFVKQGERQWINIGQKTNVFGSGFFIYFDSNNGTFGNIGAAVLDYGYEIIGNGWYRIWITGVAQSTTTHQAVIALSSTDNIVGYPGDGTSGIYICHAQLELGTESTTPIYGTEGSALTRVADVANIATDISSTKTLIINDDAYIVETALPDNGYYLPQIDIERLILSDNVLSDAQITALGATKRQLAFSSYVDIAAGTTASITVNGVGYIDWGDGNTSAYSSEVTLTHVYSSAYKGLVKFVGTLTKLSSSSSLSWYLDIANAPSNLTYLLISGSNTISGDIANAPSNLTYLYIYGSNTISGDIVDAPSNLTYLQITGSNTISGDIADAPANLTYLYIYGSSQLSDYTFGRTWANNMNYVLSTPASGYGLSSTEVDNLLIDLANVATWAGSKIVNIAGNNAARTTASDAAVATLEGKGVTVTTN